MCWPGLWSHLMAQVRENPLPSSLTWLLSGLLAVCWLEVLPQFLAIWVFPEASSQHSSCLPSETASKRRHEKWKPEFLCHWILEVTSYHFCHILFIRNDSLGPAHMQGWEDYTKAGISEGKNHWGPSWPLPILGKISNHMNNGYDER